MPKGRKKMDNATVGSITNLGPGVVTQGGGQFTTPFLNPRPQPLELGFRITEVDGGFYIQNFDVFSGNATRPDLEGVQTYVAAMLANKFTPQTNASQTQTEDPTQINEVGVEASAA